MILEDVVTHNYDETIVLHRLKNLFIKFKHVTYNSIGNSSINYVSKTIIGTCCFQHFHFLLNNEMFLPSQPAVSVFLLVLPIFVF